MFDLNKLRIHPINRKGFNNTATEIEIQELSQYFGRDLPPKYIEILKKYNGGQSEVHHFDIDDESYMLNYFFSLGDDKDCSLNVWWAINSYSQFTGAGTLPFAVSGVNEIFFFKVVNDNIEIWILRDDELETPEIDFLIGSFDELLSSLYETK